MHIGLCRGARCVRWASLGNLPRSGEGCGFRWTPPPEVRSDPVCRPATLPHVTAAHLFAAFEDWDKSAATSAPRGPQARLRFSSWGARHPTRPIMRPAGAQSSEGGSRSFRLLCFICIFAPSLLEKLLCSVAKCFCSPRKVDTHGYADRTCGHAWRRRICQS